MEIKKLDEFPYLKEFKDRFRDINDKTVFVLPDVIFCDYPHLLPNHVVTHEKVHMKQQLRLGVDKWVTQYLYDDAFRLEMEVEAYRAQIFSIHDREARNQIRLTCAKHLASELYGGIVNFQQALNVLI